MGISELVVPAGNITGTETYPDAIQRIDPLSAVIGLRSESDFAEIQRAVAGWKPIEGSPDRLTISLLPSGGLGEGRIGPAIELEGLFVSDADMLLFAGNYHIACMTLLMRDYGDGEDPAFHKEAAKRQSQPPCFGMATKVKDEPAGMFIGQHPLVKIPWNLERQKLNVPEEVASKIQKYRSEKGEEPASETMIANMIRQSLASLTPGDREVIDAIYTLLSKYPGGNVPPIKGAVAAGGMDRKQLVITRQGYLEAAGIESAAGKRADDAVKRLKELGKKDVAIYYPIRPRTKGKAWKHARLTGPIITVYTVEPGDPKYPGLFKTASAEDAREQLIIIELQPIFFDRYTVKRIEALFPLLKRYYGAGSVPRYADLIGSLLCTTRPNAENGTVIRLSEETLAERLGITQSLRRNPSRERSRLYETLRDMGKMAALSYLGIDREGRQVFFEMIPNTQSISNAYNTPALPGLEAPDGD